MNHMSEHRVTLKWVRGGAEFSYQKYPRDHTWIFDGGHTMTATAAPAYLGSAANVDPEEAFVASLSSCHMLWFLAIAAKRKFRIDRYRDLAVGTLGQNSQRQWCMTVVTLRPEVDFGGSPLPTPADIDAMHHEAHAQCFIAHSVTSEVRCEPVIRS